MASAGTGVTTRQPSRDQDRRAVAIVGRGRLGKAFAAALRAAGHEVTGPVGRGEPIGAPRAALLCVPDGQVAVAAASIAADVLVGHCSGALTLDAIGSRPAFSVHPLLPVATETTRFAGAFCAVSGNTDDAMRFAAALARDLGMTPFALADEFRPLYHAAATMASNYVVALLDAAEQVFHRSGVAREAMIPLARAAVDEWARLGGERALTGPIVRGDEGTVERQRAAIDAYAPEFSGVWSAVASLTRGLANRA
ncbi:MAG TPA: DUF2520 domain-containing protein, partial [Gemmatimonadaceae bacterium]|nr:DUF2520 domain-containing protein [Gemmatimonadaceae bacterium]